MTKNVESMDSMLQKVKSNYKAKCNSSKNDDFVKALNLFGITMYLDQHQKAQAFVELVTKHFPTSKLSVNNDGEVVAERDSVVNNEHFYDFSKYINKLV